MTKAQEMLGSCLDLINDWDRHGSIDHSLAYELHTKLSKVYSAIAQPPSPIDVIQHVAWLNQYIIGMDESNWKDMRLRAERQLEQISRDLDALAEDGEPQSPQPLIPGGVYQLIGGTAVYVGLDIFHGETTHQFRDGRGDIYIKPASLAALLSPDTRPLREGK